MDDLKNRSDLARLWRDDRGVEAMKPLISVQLCTIIATPCMRQLFSGRHTWLEREKDRKTKQKGGTVNLGQD